VTVRRVVPLLLGTQVLDRCVALGWPLTGVRERIPIPAFLVELSDGRRLLWDTGTDHAVLDEPGLFDDEFPPPDMGVDDTLSARLVAAGGGLDGVDVVGVSHLMVDHAGGLRYLPGREVVVQRAELAYAMASPDPGPYRRADYDGPLVDVTWCEIDGDVEFLPGVTALSTPGHCPGHQSLLLRMASGRCVIIASDAGDLRENFAGEVPPGILLAGRALALESVRRLNAIAAAESALLIPGHDPRAWVELPVEIV
jgi:glyoxylase-like metal-dependent hydrolase (beta-lactamase superfamily II)